MYFFRRVTILIRFTYFIYLFIYVLIYLFILSFVRSFILPASVTLYIKLSLHYTLTEIHLSVDSFHVQMLKVTNILIALRWSF